MQALERLVNLVVLLLEARLPLTFEQIRERMGGAYEQGNLASAKRMFERDKDLARDFGVPIELENVDAWETEQGYVIRKDRYYLPEIAFTPEEVSALYLAAQGGEPDDPAAIGVRKLLSAAGDSILGQSGGMPGIADTGEPHLAAVATALADGRALRFSYRTSMGEVAERTVDPFGLTFRSGHWYLVGHDRDREEIRVFRLSRIASALADAGESAPRPDGFSAAEMVAVDPWGPGEPQSRARVAVTPEARWLAVVGASQAEVVETLADGWTVLSIPAGDPAWLASWVLSFGTEARVIEPEELRAEVVRRLEAVVGG